MTAAGRPAVAVTAVHLACGLGDTPEAVWSAVTAAVPGLTARGPRHHCGQLARGDGPEEAVRLAVHHATAAWAAAGLDHARPAPAPERTALVLGTTDWGAPDFAHHLPGHRVRALARPHTAADAIAAALGLTGPREVFVNGCVASASALGHAAELIRTGHADAVLVGGVNLLDDSVLAAFDSWRALDRAPCSPYGRSAGTSLGEGVAFLVLEAAGRPCADPLGYLLGHALAGDAHHITAPHPQGEGLRRAVTAALADAGLAPGLVGYVNGHGTGTRANDSAELLALEAVFGDRRPPLSSTKSQVGHTLGASGTLEAAVTLLGLRHRALPPTLNSPVGPAGWDIVAGEARPEPRLRYAVSTSAGFGGQNAALVFGSAPPNAMLLFGAAPVRRDGDEVVAEVPVTGAGVVHPAAIGRAGFLAHLRTGGAAPLEAALDEARLAELIDPADLPRLDAFGRIVLAAARLAESDALLGAEAGGAVGAARAGGAAGVAGAAGAAVAAGVPGAAGARPESERIGVVLATASGPVATHTAMAELHARGLAPSPLLAPNAVAGVPAGYAALALGARGPACVVSAGDASGLLALGQAAELIRAGRADTVYVIAADEAAPALRTGFAHHGLLAKEAGRPYDVDADGGALTPAGVALVLESAASAARRGARVLGRVLGHAAAGALDSDPDPGAALARCLAGAARRSGLATGTPLHLYGTAWGHPPADAAEARALTALPGRLANITGTAGYTQAAGALLSVLAALEACADPSLGRRPLTGTRDPLPEVARALATASPDRPTAALVAAGSRGGTRAAAAVRATD
ncbi:beta-ketoacyl synthase N-terminal-like domain-containing protein [Streptomyces sp. NPDC048337]|uniref:beta-ketoacyl synthase N-terminal-like domain-containing protein n=1 Tax=Streptomyces sp. NPDC048337 TaxID=3365535 RepID=UPI00371E4BA9